MACYRPLEAYEGRPREAGKVNVVWRRAESLRGKVLNLPCGRCIGCRLERSRQWAIRCMYEASMFKENCFLTLTYAPESLPANGTLVLKDVLRFLKRVRRENPGRRIRYFHCGEYGELLARPHYHVLLFNFDFDDKQLWKTEGGNKFYVSPSLSRLWMEGHHLIGDVTFETAAYVARYCLKKITGEMAEDHYAGRAPEYVTMSRRPGIGHDWYQKFKSDVYPSDFLVVNGGKVKPPRYFDKLLELEDPKAFEVIKARRRAEGDRMTLVTLEDGRKVLVRDNDTFRLAVREEHKELEMLEIPRRYEEGI